MGDEVKFSKGLAWLGAVGGICIAVGVPTMLVLYGQFIGAVGICILSGLAIVTGGGLAIAAAIIGTVIPSRAGG